MLGEGGIRGNLEGFGQDVANVRCCCLEGGGGGGGHPSDDKVTLVCPSYSGQFNTHSSDFA